MRALHSLRAGRTLDAQKSSPIPRAGEQAQENEEEMWKVARQRGRRL
jgi:hypothetical protein